MEEHLKKRQRAGLIDFIEVPLEWGTRNKEFVGFNLQDKTFFRIFYDNKYRQDNFKPDVEKQKQRVAELSEGLNDLGLYNTKEEYRRQKEILDFYQSKLTLLKNER